jgi:hypothetical protein
MRDVYPVKYYKDEGFVEYKIEINKREFDVRITAPRLGEPEGA